MIGMFAVSLAGHDKGQTYLIVGEENDFVYLADGKLKTIEKPKRKKKKHIQIIKSNTDVALAEKLKSHQTIYNEEIKCAVKARINRR